MLSRLRGFLRKENLLNLYILPDFFGEVVGVMEKARLASRAFLV